MTSDGLQSVGRFVVMAGFGLVFLGALLWVAGRLGLGRLPGDIRWQRGSFVLYAPIGTALLVSLGLTVLLNVFLWILGRR
jgi:hypothetical protein